MSELNSLLLFGSAPKGAIEATSNLHDKAVGKNTRRRRFAGARLPSVSVIF
jgi:hypothetical protein